MKKCLCLLIALTLAGCSQPTAPAPGKPAAEKSADKGKAKGSDHDHDHGEGPHGGTIADWGGGKYHVEFCVDHGKQEATVYMLGGDAETPAPLEMDKLLLTIKTPSFQVELKGVADAKDPKGKFSKFVGKHEKLGVEQEFEGTISGEIGGKPFAGDFKEEPAAKKKK